MTWDMEAFRAIWRPEDEYMQEPGVEAHYRSKFDLVAQLQPQSICEIGVRAGYSAWCFRRAAPAAAYLGVDIDDGRWGGTEGLLTPAGEMIRAAAPRSFASDIHVTLGNSLDIPYLGGWHFWHVDGDHSLAGCLSDLLLARRGQARWILVDDFDYIPEVRLAVNAFKSRFASETYASAMPTGVMEFSARRIEDGGYRGQVLFTRLAP